MGLGIPTLNLAPTPPPTVQVQAISTPAAPTPAPAAPAPAALAPPTVSQPVGQPVDLPGASVSDFGVDLRVAVSVESGTLSVDAPAPAAVIVPFGYPAVGASGPQLAFEGSEADLTTLLTTLSWTPAIAGAVKITVDAGPKDATYDGGTTHYYRYVADPSATWASAKAAAELTPLADYSPYLATVNTLGEQALLSRIAPAPAWLGGSDSGKPGTWIWTTEPQNPATFWDAPGCTATTTPSCFAVWAVGEPNPTGAHYLQLDAQVNGGVWLAKTGTAATAGYLVEYDAPASTSTILDAHGTTMLTATAVDPGAPTAVTAVAATRSATVSWQAPTFDGGSPVTHYLVSGSPAGSCDVAAPATTCVVPGLDGATSYTFQVQAKNATHQGALSTPPSSAVTPRASTTVTLSSTASAKGVKLTATLTGSLPHAAGVSSPDGLVTFKDGSGQLGLPVMSKSGSASITPTFATGIHLVTAAFAGNSNFGAATSDSMVIVVTAPPPTTAPPTTAPPTTAPPTTAAPTTEAPTTTAAPATTAAPTTASVSSVASAAPAGGEASSTLAPVAPALHMVFDVGVGVKVADARLTVRGVGLKPRSMVTVTAHSTPTLLASTGAGSSGTLTQQMSLPSNLTDGDHQVIAKATAANGSTVIRIVPFAVKDGILTRIGAVEVEMATPTAAPTSVATADPVSLPGTTPAAPKKGDHGLPLPLILLLVAGLAGGLFWWRSKRSATATAAPAQAGAKPSSAPGASRPAPAPAMSGSRY